MKNLFFLATAIILSFSACNPHAGKFKLNPLDPESDIEVYRITGAAPATQGYNFQFEIDWDLLQDPDRVSYIIIWRNGQNYKTASKNAVFFNEPNLQTGQSFTYEISLALSNPAGGTKRSPAFEFTAE